MRNTSDLKDLDHEVGIDYLSPRCATPPPLCNIWEKNMLELSLLRVGTTVLLSRKGCVVNGQKDQGPLPPSVLPCTSCTRLVKDDSGQVKGAAVRDTMTGQEWEIAAKAVINATGCFCDSVR